MILILYIESGSGSLMLAKNIKKHLDERQVNNQLISLNKILPLWLEKLLFGHYQRWCMESSSKFSYLFNSRWFYPMLYKILPAVIRYKDAGKNQVPESFQYADAVIGCSFYCCWFARYWQKISGTQHSIFGVLGDYTVSPGWQLQLDRLFIPFDFQSPVFDYIRRCGGNITVTGIPVKPYQMNGRRVKGSVLLCGGGWGLQITEETITTLLARKSLTKLIVLCGQNNLLYDNLCSQFQDYISRDEMEVHGFIDDMYSIYARTDIVVTKAGGLTLTEAAIYRKPLIISGYLPGHEKENMKVFVQRDAALLAEDAETLGQAIDKILMDDISADLLKKNATLLVNHQAGNLLCDEILEDMHYVDA
ncbi:glycosyltransferase [Serratia bockelmannii]|uniref:glycosyltransferase n=1 Tax=Serratia TaxID=613 RepID=UPI00146F8534|nr:glycosyltransferase [Serratia marcescens]NMT27153.1 glycosyltransferase [Serratia marcescens]